MEAIWQKYVLSSKSFQISWPTDLILDHLSLENTPNIDKVLGTKLFCFSGFLQQQKPGTSEILNNRGMAP